MLSYAAPVFSNVPLSSSILVTIIEAVVTMYEYTFTMDVEVIGMWI